MDVLSGDIGRECRTLLAVGADGGGLAGEQAALFVPYGVVVFGGLGTCGDVHIVSCSKGDVCILTCNIGRSCV